MVIVYNKKTGEIVYTEENRMISTFDSEDRTKALGDEGLASVGVNYELGPEVFNNKAAVGPNGEFLGIVAKTSEEG